MRLVLFVILNAFCLSLYSQNTISFTYDKLNRLSQIIIAPCKLIQYQYDNEGNRISQTEVFIQVRDSIVKSCFGQSTGKIFLSSINPISRYRYTRNTGYVGPNLLNVPPGLYTVTITDSSSNLNCQIQLAIGVVSVDSFLVTQRNPVCFGSKSGSISISRAFSNTGSFAYNWSIGSQDSSISHLGAGTYSVLITNTQTGCKKDYSINIVEPADRSTVYPNPTSGKVSIEFCSERNDTLAVQVFNIQGQLLMQYTRKVNASNNTEVLDFGTYPSGIYFVKLEFNGDTQIRRVVKL